MGQKYLQKAFACDNQELIASWVKVMVKFAKLLSVQRVSSW